MMWARSIHIQSCRILGHRWLYARSQACAEKADGCFLVGGGGCENDMLIHGKVGESASTGGIVLYFRMNVRTQFLW